MKPVSPLCMDHTGLYSSLLNIGEKYVSVGAHCHDTFGGQWTASGLGPYLRWAFCCCCSLCVPRLTGLRTSRDLCLSFPFYLRTLGYRHMLLCWLYKGSGFKLRFLCFYDNCYTHWTILTTLLPPTPSIIFRSFSKFVLSHGYKLWDSHSVQTTFSLNKVVIQLQCAVLFLTPTTRNHAYLLALWF